MWTISQEGHQRRTPRCLHSPISGQSTVPSVDSISHAQSITKPLSIFDPSHSGDLCKPETANELSITTRSHREGLPPCIRKQYKMYLHDIILILFQNAPGMMVAFICMIVLIHLHDCLDPTARFRPGFKVLYCYWACLLILKRVRGDEKNNCMPVPCLPHSCIATSAIATCSLDADYRLGSPLVIEVILRNCIILASCPIRPAFSSTFCCSNQLLIPRYPLLHRSDSAHAAGRRSFYGAVSELSAFRASKSALDNSLVRSLPLLAVPYNSNREGPTPGQKKANHLGGLQICRKFIEGLSIYSEVHEPSNRPSLELPTAGRCAVMSAHTFSPKMPDLSFGSLLTVNTMCSECLCSFNFHS